MTNKHHNNFWTSLLTPLMDRRGNSTDANNNLTTLSDGKGKLRTADSVAGKQDLQMTYSYAADKQITAETIAEDVLADTSFTASYDAGNRITNWNRAGAPVNNAQSWNYDDNGNWISTTKDGVTEARNHDNTDVDYRYDALGRRVIRQEGTTKTALIWWGNSEKHRRLVGVLDRMSGASEARRVKAREASLNQCAEHKHQAGQIHFIPFSLRQVVGSPPSLQIMRRQSRYSVVIQNDIMAHPSRLNSVIARAVDGSKFKLEWYHKNYLDHVYAVSDDSGDILEHYRYTAFGEVTIYNANGNQVATTQIDNHILWNTRRRDEVTGFYMYKFRHYSAELGRWLARDPIGERGGVNLYAFVGNDGVNRWDRLGLDKFVPEVDDVRTNTMDRAASFGLLIAAKMQRKDAENFEYSGAICCKEGKFSITGPYRGNNRQQSNKEKTLSCPDGWILVAYYHSHPGTGSFNTGDSLLTINKKIWAYVVGSQLKPLYGGGSLNKKNLFDDMFKYRAGKSSYDKKENIFKLTDHQMRIMGIYSQVHESYKYNVKSGVWDPVSSIPDFNIQFYLDEATRVHEFLDKVKIE